MFERAIYYMTASSQHEHWERHWSGREIEAEVKKGPRKAWWPLLLESLDGVGRDEWILEAGCGVAQFVKLLQDRGRQVLGIDFAADALQSAHQACPELRLSVQDARSLGLADRSVGMVISLGVVEHFEAGPSDLLSESARVLREGGQLFITVPYFNLIRKFREPWRRLRRELGRPRDLVFYQYAFDPAEFEQLLAADGFVIRRVLLHHSHVSLRNDFSDARWFRILFADPRDPEKLRSGRLRRVASVLDWVSPRIASHMMLVVAERRSDAPTSTGTR